MRRRAEVHKQIGTVTKVLVLTIDGADSDPTRDATAGLDEERSSPVVCGYRTTHKGVTMNTSRTPRVGYTMFNVLLYVAEHPSCTQQAAAIYAGPNGSQGYGARSVQRCLTGVAVMGIPTRPSAMLRCRLLGTVTHDRRHQ